MSKSQLSSTQPNLDKIKLSSLTRGMSQATLFRFEIEEHYFVIRLLPPTADVLERTRQISLMSNSAKIGAGPKIHYISPELDALVMDFIHGTTVSPKTFADEVNLTNFAKFLRKLHQSPIQLPIACSPFQRFRNFLQSDGEYSTEMIKVITLMTEIEQTLNLYPTPLAPTHLDLHSQNIMLEGSQFFLVDWVNGGMSDPFMDLTTFSIFLDFNDEQVPKFLREYLGRNPSQLEWGRLTILQPVRLFVIAANLLGNSLKELSTSESNRLLCNSKLPSFQDFIQKHSTGELDWPFRQLGFVLLKQGLHLASQPVFQKSLQRLQEQAIKQPLLH